MTNMNACIADRDQPRTMRPGADAMARAALYRSSVVVEPVEAAVATQVDVNAVPYGGTEKPCYVEAEHEATNFERFMDQGI